jgi:hypothetical protein
MLEYAFALPQLLQPIRIRESLLIVEVVAVVTLPLSRTLLFHFQLQLMHL